MSIRPTLTLICSVAVCALAVAPEVATAQGGGSTAVQQPEKAAPKQIYDEAPDAKKQIADALAKAKKENRRVLIQWGANWCGWCQLLHERCASDAGLRRKLMYEYDVVLIDIGRFDKNMELAAEYGADLRASGVPFLTILDAEGQVLTNQETESFETKIDGQNGHDAGKLVKFLEKHQAEYLDADTVLSAALAKAGESGRVVFVHFGAPWCGWCHRLEDWMAGKEVAAILAKDFVEVKIDTDRMNGGGEMLKRYRKSDGGGIPWFAFLNAEGETVATSDGPNGNVGCPWTDEEISAFGDILRKARLNLSDAAVDRLLQKLRDFRDATK